MSRPVAHVVGRGVGEIAARRRSPVELPDRPFDVCALVRLRDLELVPQHGASVLQPSLRGQRPRQADPGGGDLVAALRSVGAAELRGSPE